MLPALARGVLVGAWALAALVHLSLGPAQRHLVWPASYLVLEVLATVSLANRAWRSTGQRRVAWGLLAASAFLEVPNLAVTLLAAAGWACPYGGTVTVLFTTATGVLVLAGVLNFPKGRDVGPGRQRRALDGLIFATSLLFLLWAAGVHGAVRSAHPNLGLRLFAAYLNAALLGGGLVFMTSYHPLRFRGPLGWLSASALAWVAGLSVWALTGLPGALAERPWILLAGCIPLFQGLAAWSRPPAEEGVDLADSARLSRLLPYVPVLGTLVVMAFLIPRGSAETLRGASGIFLVMVGLLLLRQFQAIQDLWAARLTLEDRVRQRTEALERAQTTLLRTEKLNTLALMGAGLAHDLNNLLASMKSSAELALEQHELGEAAEPNTLRRIATTADRAASLTTRLLGFARREMEELAPTELGPAVQAMEATLRLILPRSVTLVIQTQPGLLVWSSRLRLEQMLVNLVVNARDAMPDGGALTILAREDPAESGLVAMEVADTGVGMAPEILDRIFELFFTTKAPGRGTGMGLASLKALVEEGGGRMEVTSQPGMGSRFRILLPRLLAES